MMTFNPVQTCRWVVSAVVVALGAGCAGSGASPVQDIAANAPPVDPIINAAAFGEPEGLEIRWWIVRDDTDALTRGLRPYLNQSLPIDDETSERLRACGFRLVAVPMDDLLGLRSRLPLVGRIDRRWVGQTAAWVEGVSGPRFAHGRTVRLGHERLSIPPGALRLLTRAWKEPGVPEGRLRIDFALQHVDAATLDPQRSVLEFTAARSIVDEGLIFTSTLAELSASASFFYLLVPESPERDWRIDDDEESDDSEADEPAASDDEPVAEPLPWSPEATVEEALVQGPPAAGIPTLGELMLMQAPDPMTGRSLRAVIVIVPRVQAGDPMLP